MKNKRRSNKSSKNESIVTKMKVSFIEKKVLHLRNSIPFQSKCFMYIKESITLNRKFYLCKRNYDSRQEVLFVKINYQN